MENLIGFLIAGRNILYEFLIVKQNEHEQVNILSLLNNEQNSAFNGQ